jgi:hypothetical protein
MWYTSLWSRFELTTSVVIGIDCISSCKSNYRTIMATTAPVVNKSNNIEQLESFTWTFIYLLNCESLSLFTGKKNYRSGTRKYVTQQRCAWCFIYNIRWYQYISYMITLKKKIIHTVGTVPKSNRIRWNRDSIYTSNTDIHDGSI